MLQDILKEFDFSQKESDLYLAILQQGKVTPTDLAKITGINRTTVYSVAKELIKKGVVAEDLGGKNSYLVARPPQDLAQIVKKDEKKLEIKKQMLEKAVEELANFSKNTKYAVPKIVFIGEDDLESYLYKQTPVWNESIAQYDGHWWGFQDQSFVRFYEEWIDWYWQSGSPKNIKLRLLSNKTAESIKQKKFPNRIIKLWTDGNFTSTIWVNGDYVIMIVTSQKPHYLVEIHDMVLAHNLREVFKGIWKNTK